MAKPKGAPKSGGRQRGTPNTATARRQAEVAASGPTPLDALIKKMRFHLAIFDGEVAKGEEADGKALALAMDKAAEAARDAAPYVHPRLATVAHTGADDGPIQHALTINAKQDLIQRIAEITARLHETKETRGS